MIASTEPNRLLGSLLSQDPVVAVESKEVDKAHEITSIGGEIFESKGVQNHKALMAFIAEQIKEKDELMNQVSESDKILVASIDYSLTDAEKELMHKGNSDFCPSAKKMGQAVLLTSVVVGIFIKMSGY